LLLLVHSPPPQSTQEFHCEVVILRRPLIEFA